MGFGQKLLMAKGERARAADAAHNLSEAMGRISEPMSGLSKTGKAVKAIGRQAEHQPQPQSSLYLRDIQCHVPAVVCYRVLNSAFLVITGHPEA